MFGGEEVKIISLHAAKGLEFKVTYIVGVRDGTIPFFVSEKEDGQQGVIREQLLLYVGMTRAIKELYMSYNWDDGDGWHRKCSRFLIGIAPEFLTVYGK